MFRPVNGFKTQYHYLTLLVASDFDEWRVILQGPGVCIQGGRQFNEVKAKQHALQIADDYIHNEKHETLPAPSEVAWQPFAQGEFLAFRP